MPLPQPNARPDRLALVLYAEGCREPLFCCPQTHSVIWTKIKTSQLGPPPPEKLASSEIIIIQTQAQNFHRSGSASHMLYGGGAAQRVLYASILCFAIPNNCCCVFTFCFSFALNEHKKETPSVAAFRLPCETPKSSAWSLAHPEIPVQTEGTPALLQTCTIEHQTRGGYKSGSKSGSNFWVQKSMFLGYMYTNTMFLSPKACFWAYLVGSLSSKVKILHEECREIGIR